ncbi:MAG: undecaprenyl-diphosphatase UppP [Patescibacteria group bacterium]
MTIIQAIILGAIQGITEFLPISSSGHLIIFPEFLGWEQQGAAFDVMIHLATLLAIIWVLFDDIVDIFKRLTKKSWKQSEFIKIAVATVPVVIFGLIVSGAFFDSVRTVQVVAINLIVFGGFLWFADWYSTKIKGKVKKTEDITWKQAIFVGVSQMIALIPGVSRSGVTITGGLFAGLDRKTAARFSFLLAIPAIAGAGLLVSFDVIQTGLETPVPSLIAGFISAFIFGSLAIKFLLKILVRSDYRWFAVYRIGLGLILLALGT